MTDTIRTILERRSVRAFTDAKVEKDTLDEILRCACWAPSANNTQNWHFTALRDRAVIEKVNDWLVAEITVSGAPNLHAMLERAGGKIFRNAPCVVIVSAEKQDRFGIVNASAATQNMLLAAHSLGLGSCWIGTVAMLGASKNADRYASELKLPAGYATLFGVTLGYAAAAAVEAPARKEGLATFI